MNGEKGYDLNAIDSKTKFDIAEKYVKKRIKKAVNDFFKKIKDCCYDQILERYEKERHKPRKKRKLITFVSDKFWNYRSGFTKFFSRVAKLVFGVPIACIKYGLEYNNNHVEKYNQELNDRYKTMRHFKSHVFAEAFFGMKQVIHNFINPNIELNGKTPAQAAEIKLKLGRSRLLSLIRITAKKYR